MDYRRNFQPGGTFFFTVVTYNRQGIFSDPDAVAALRAIVRDEKHRRPFRMEAWVIMPDHLHMIWTLPPGDADFARRWSSIKGNFTRTWLNAGGREGYVGAAKQREERRGVWQPKYMEHTIKDEGDFQAHVEYIHYNPVKHGCAKCPIDWTLSSFSEYVARSTYPPNWCCQDREATNRVISTLPDCDWLE